MNASSVSRIALFLSIVAVALALVTRTTGGRNRPGASGAEPDARAWAEESLRRSEVLGAEVEALRGDLASLQEELQRSLERRAPAAAQPANEREPVAAGTSETRAPDAPREFQLRRELLEGFHELGKSDRQDALDRLAELARWGDAEALALIVESLTDGSPGVRARALEELARLDEANLPAYLRAAIDDPSHRVREVVASRLDELPEQEAGPLLVGLLRDPDPGVVLEAIRSLDDLEYAEARPALVEQLQSRSLDVATHAAKALIALGEPAASGGTIQRILADFAEDDVSGRIDNVKRLRRLRAVDPLERILESDASLAVREEAREALARLED